jgi:multiple sugar transport system substrate-binding protein
MTRLGALVHYRAAALAALVLMGCAGAESGAREVRLWAMGREGELVQRLMPEFERRHPEVRVRVQQIPWSAAHEKLLTAFVGRAMPDVFQLGSTWIPEFAAIGAAAPLDSRLGESGMLRADDYFAGILDANRVDGATRAVPWYVDTRLLFYRTDLLARAGFRAAPADWQSWTAAMAAVQAASAPGNYAILLPVSEWQPPVILALQKGATLLRDGDRYGDFRSPAFRAAFEFYLDLFRRGLASNRAEAQIANLYQDFAAGFFAFYISGPWNIAEFTNRLPAALQGQWSTAPMPAPQPGTPGISIAGGASLALSRGARDPQAAWWLIEYLSEPATQIEFYRLTGDLPARRSAWADPALADNRYAQAFWTQLQHLRSPPKIAEWERIAAKITAAAEAAVRGDLSTEAALEGLDRDVDALLEKRRWLLDREAARRCPERTQRAQSTQRDAEGGAAPAVPSNWGTERQTQLSGQPAPRLPPLRSSAPSAASAYVPDRCTLVALQAAL